MTVSDVKGAPGSKVFVPIVLAEGKDISGVQFTVGFDSDVLSFVDDKAPVRGDLLVDHSVGASRQGRRLSVVVFSSSLSKLKAGSGTVVGLIFQVAGSASRGTATTIRLSDVQASDESGRSITVATRDGTILITNEPNLPSAGANELIFPQIVNGSFPGGNFVTTLVFVNRTGAVTTGEARLFKSDGTPFSVRLADERAGSSFTFTVAEGASVLLKTDGSGPLSAGYARVSATAPLGGTALFSQLDDVGQTLAEAGVGASAPSTRFSIPVLYRRGVADTGIAFANISSQRADLALALRNGAGALVESQSATLAAGQHLPRFATELFRSLANQAEFTGTIEVSTPVSVAAVALKQQGGLITAFPVIGAQYVPLAAGSPVPAISAIVPASATAGGAAFTLAVNGSNFVTDSSVRWNGSARPTTFVGNTQLRAQISAADIASTGTASVTVFNAAPGGGISNAVTFTVSAAPAGGPRIEVSPASLDFGTVSVGQSKDLSFTVRNTGNGALTVNSITSSNARFTVISPSLPFTVAAGSQQSVTARFAPTEAGSQTGTLTIASNDPRGATVNVSGVASAGTVPTISDVTVTRLTNDSAKIDVQISDPDGDIVKIEYTFFRAGVQQSTRVVNSPADVNLAGFTSGTVSREFTGIGVVTPFGTVLPDRVDVEATDARGLKSNKFSKSF